MFRMALLVAGALLALTVQGWAQDRKDDQEAAKLVGTWTVTAEEKDGKQATADKIQGKQVRITRDTITCADRSGKSDMACEYKLDTSSKPWQITMTCTEGEHKGQKLMGIVQLEGETARVCFSKPDSPAPTGFRTQEGQCCVTLKRAAAGTRP